jgi:tRNA (cytidine56-2'-O)-methyltransferase
MYLAADDTGILRSVSAVVERWGGNFFVRNRVGWRGCISHWKEQGGTVVHLTMYGTPVREVIGELRSRERILVVVGAEKVPGAMYGLADYNVSVTTQPHSEVASLAVFLDHLFGGEELNREYPDALMRIVPSSAGKVREGR